jgi:iron complex transport system substrate-binding protein
VLLAAAACGERSEPTGRSADLYPVTVQSGERSLVVDAPAKRIAVVDRSSEAIVRALGAGSRIVGPPPSGRIQLAALRRARPDLIVARADANERDLSSAGTTTGADVYTAPGDSIRQVERAITQLGLLTGRPVQARALVRRIEAQRKRIAARLAGIPQVSVFVDTGFFTTVSGQSLIGDLVREARGRNVAAESADAGPLELDDLLELDPAVYLAMSDSSLTLADLRRNPRTKNLRAVRNGRFSLVNVDLVQPGPRIGDGLAQIARLLHPNAFR